MGTDVPLTDFLDIIPEYKVLAFYLLIFVHHYKRTKNQYKKHKYEQ